MEVKKKPNSKNYAHNLLRPSLALYNVCHNRLGKVQFMTIISKLQSTQNRIMKLMYGSHTDEVYKTNKMLNIKNANDYFSAIKLYRDINCDETRYFAQRISQFNLITIILRVSQLMKICVFEPNCRH